MERAPYAAELLVQAGQQLFGEGWQSDLARLLELDLRTVQRIARAARVGQPYRIAAATMDRLAQHVRDRERGLKRTWMDIKRGYAA